MSRSTRHPDRLGWLTIWNKTRAEQGKPPLDLKDRDQSLVWRFELRMGSKQLRRRWEIRNWFDLDAMIGDAYAAFLEKVRYCEVSTDSNRSRWPPHPLWRVVENVIADDLTAMRSGVVPDDVKTASREEHKRMLDMQLLGLMVSRAAADPDIDGDLIYVFVSIGNAAGEDRFFILEQPQIQQMVNGNHVAWLGKHGGIRPKNPQSTHTAVHLAQLADFEGNWALIERHLSD
ncbi:hypothetical protein SAMN05444414_1315 [Roseovarius marisflavi]|uniref:Uncharacterized protein n=1 Tax=Roseovarius marisflavi TaxID=1054996 RepID=A0A1M7CVW4_9RHOB|nr:hypothetical protein [Roseovarius marisflavi]SHL71243.1 hypothetical protein SAMN05444414_1315 [Roseovarius marisflavi]